MSVNGNQAGGLVSAFSSLTSAFSNANAQSSVDTFKANQLQLSSQASNLQAQSILQTGEQNQGLVGIKAKQQIGQSKASFGGQGVVTSTGSAAAVQSSEAGQAALSEETIKSNAWREAWGLQVNASNEASEAQMTELEGQEQANNTLLTGGMKAMADITNGYIDKGK